MPKLGAMYTEAYARYWGDFGKLVNASARAANKTPSMPGPDDKRKIAMNNARLLNLMKDEQNAAANFHIPRIGEFWGRMAMGDLEGANRLIEEEIALVHDVLYEQPRALDRVSKKFGLQLHRDEMYAIAAETTRAKLYRVYPIKGEMRQKEKPFMLLTPVILGNAVAGFLPEDGISLIHAYANSGTPTYIVVLNDVGTCAATAGMTMEDYARDIRYFASCLKEKHGGLPVTLGGICQGGFFAAVAVLSGILKGKVDALTTFVAPFEGRGCTSIVDQMEMIPEAYCHLRFATEVKNGNHVVGGDVMSFFMALASGDTPLKKFYGDMAAVGKLKDIALAVKLWLSQSKDLPVGLTEFSLESFKRPIAEDGTLPVKLFGKSLNLQTLPKLGMHAKVCIAQKDVLVPREASTAPFKYWDGYEKATLVEFPKGHVAMFTEHCRNGSPCYIGETMAVGEGPVAFHLRLERELLALKKRNVRGKVRV